VLEPEGTRGAREIEAGAPLHGVIGIVVALELAAREHEVARGEFARVVALHQENLEAAGGTIAQQHQRGGRRGHDRLFDGHGVV